LLEQRKLTVKDDAWRLYSLILNENDKEEYVSTQIDSIIREWRNWIYEHRQVMYTLDVLKDAFHQIAKVNEFHSQQKKVKSVTWDGVDRFEAGAKAFGLKIAGEGEENQFTLKAFRHHLLASVARLFYPGVWYDLILCVFGAQGAGKTTGLRLLYGRDNVISCNFFELDQKQKSEATRHGIWAVENPDTFGDARKADFNKIKADQSIDSFVGRDAYGRVEDMRRINITYVVWYTGNEVKVLRDPTGNRRCLIIYSERPIDEDWLRLNAGQLWAQVYIEMEQLRAQYLEDMRHKGINEEYPKYLELPKDLWEESEKRANASMVTNEHLEDWVPEIIFQNFVVWPSSENMKPTAQSKSSGVPHKLSIHVLTRDILKFLQDKGYKGPITDQIISTAMQKHVVLAQDKCEGLNEDIKWRRAQILRSHGNLRGYRIDFAGESKQKAFVIIKEMFANYNKSPEENYVQNNSPM
jgi:Virulence-associated protein E